ncbi:MAG: SHOCT domain-containing protein, partial [Rubrivivax sp.]|nr:SHOCT domain-containing protein [Rubrivivax sp.]
MGIADELTRLDELRSRGVLTEDEFQRAKARLLDGPPPPPMTMTSKVLAMMWSVKPGHSFGTKIHSR